MAPAGATSATPGATVRSVPTTGRAPATEGHDAKVATEGRRRIAEPASVPDTRDAATGAPGATAEDIAARVVRVRPVMIGDLVAKAASVVTVAPVAKVVTAVRAARAGSVVTAP